MVEFQPEPRPALKPCRIYYTVLAQVNEYNQQLACRNMVSSWLEGCCHLQTALQNQMKLYNYQTVLQERLTFSRPDGLALIIMQNPLNAESFSSLSLISHKAVHQA